MNFREGLIDMKTILVTGSSRGIGKAIAELAHTQGYKVIVYGKSDSDALNQTHKQLEGSHKVVFDVADKIAVKTEMEKLIKEVGSVDVLVNNAGVARNFLKDLREVDDVKAVEEFSTNVLGTLHCIQAVLPGMLEKGSGSVINIASIKGHPNLSTLSTLTFATTKAGIISLTKSLAKAYPTVRFNSVSPGYIETDQVNDWNEETFKRIADGTIMGRIGKTEEVAPLVMLLASDESSYITGTDFLLDGGYSIKGK
jgi:3-oxoacyl-[acyl-carrier protein] reductase